MPAVLLRVFFICSLLNSLILFFLPKRLRRLLRPSSCAWNPPEKKSQQPQAAGKVQPGRRSCSPPPAAQLSRMAAVPGPATDAAELKRVFQMFDRNGDGRITQKELSDSLGNLGIHIPDKDLVAMIEKIDANGDGCVDMDEFGALYQTIMDEKDEEEDMREAFNVFDQNGDGFITVEELRSVLASLGLKQGRTVEDCRKMIRKVDVDGDGMVNFKEFKQMMRGGGFAALSG
ncbi:hypothetical protein Taro_007219 [Colocasia esculenta]|uniref:EF-hand domain-containing protein n=1 Tax=Colocasia esculenta TaxID=4460 RepID=A0A843TXL1_COLES|nr:hypothetical protein [Colocasia esculenta]